MPDSIKNFKDRMKALLFLKGIGKENDSLGVNPTTEMIVNEINKGTLNADIIKAIATDGIIYPEKKAICELVEKSNHSLYEMYRDVKGEINIDVNELYKAEPFMSKEAFEDMRMDILTEKIFTDKPIFAEKVEKIENNQNSIEDMSFNDDER